MGAAQKRHHAKAAASKLANSFMHYSLHAAVASPASIKAFSIHFWSWR